MFLWLLCFCFLLLRPILAVGILLCLCCCSVLLTFLLFSELPLVICVSGPSSALFAGLLHWVYFASLFSYLSFFHTLLSLVFPYVSCSPLFSGSDSDLHAFCLLFPLSIHRVSPYCLLLSLVVDVATCCLISRFVGSPCSATSLSGCPFSALFFFLVSPFPFLGLF